MSTSLAQTPLQQRLQIAPSIRQQNVVRATEEYAAAHVEPLLNELVTFLCLQKPRKKDLGKFIVEYLRMKKEGKELAPDPDPKSAFKRTDIDAAIRGLMHEMVLKKPDKPLDFLFALASETFADADDF